MTTPADVLRFLADIASVGAREPSLVWDVRRAGPVVASRVRWVSTGIQPPHLRQILTPLHDQLVTGEEDPAETDRLRTTVERSRDDRRRWRGTVALHGEQEVGRRADVALAGRGVVDGMRRSVVVPLVATVVDGRGRPLGDPEPTVVAEHLGIAEDVLLAAVGVRTPPGMFLLHRTPIPGDMPRTRRLTEVVVEAGVALDGVAVGDHVGNALHADRRLWLCVGEILHVELPEDETPRVEALRHWAATDPAALEETALGALYDVDAAGEPAVDEVPIAAGWPDRPRSPLPLTVAQRAAVAEARGGSVAVVSGAPGTGKSHTAVAAALDEVRRGGSVLLATRSGHAADVLADLLDRGPGPRAVRFGGSRSRRALAEELAAGLPAAPGRGDRRSAARREDEAAAALREAAELLASLLAVAGGGPDATTVALLRTDVPGAFDHSVEPDEAGRLLARASAEGGWWTNWRASRAAGRLRELLRTAPDVPLERVAAALSLARVRRLAAELEDTGGLDMAAARDRLATALAELRTAVGRRLDVLTTGAPGRDQRRAVAGLAAALRAGPARRAALLARLDGHAMTGAMPLWIGTVGEVERLLPRTPGLFDLLVLDEASQLDQLVAAPALARARRVLVVGDPRQLRHVSFVADLAVEEAMDRHDVGSLGPVLDVRRVSTFDAAAAVAPVRWLDEHLRSSPHLIAFSAERFYDDHLHVATAHPSNRQRDAIDTVHVVGATVDGVVAAEVDEVVAACRRLAAEQPSGTTVGVVTPFRPQADAIEQAVLDRLDVDEVERLRLRVGTVHAFQGAERDVVVVSVGLTEDDPPQRRRFAQDPHLVNVMVTRARRSILVVTALPVGTDGLLGEYLAHAEEPPRPPPGTVPTDRWTRELLAELDRNGLPVRPGPPVGRARVELVLGEGDDAVALLTVPHPDGVEADAERWGALRRAGWVVREEYATPTDDDAVGRALAVRRWWVDR